jgi:hypothetical protein
MRNCSTIFLLALLLAAGSPLAARDIFVDNAAGDDTQLGTREHAFAEFNGPVRTIARALRLAHGEDRIVLANTGVPYRESISLVGEKHSGSIVPFVLEGNGSTLEGSARVPPELWENFRGPVFRFRPVRLAFGQLFLNGHPLRFHPPTPMGGPPRLEELEWTLAGGFLYFRIEPDKLIEDYALTAPADQVGITLYNVHDVVVRDLTVQGFSLDGINAHDGVRDCSLETVTCRGNGRSGIAIVNSSRLAIIDSLIGDNLYAQVYTEGLSFTRIESSDLLPLLAPKILRRGGVVFVDGEPFAGGE